jgi:hypothetical protein
MSLSAMLAMAPMVCALFDGLGSAASRGAFGGLGSGGNGGATERRGGVDFHFGTGTVSQL